MKPIINEYDCIYQQMNWIKYKALIVQPALRRKSKKMLQKSNEKHQNKGKLGKIEHHALNY